MCYDKTFLIFFMFLEILPIHSHYFSYDEAVRVRKLLKSRNIDPDVVPVPPEAALSPFKVSAIFYMDALVDVDVHQETMRLTSSIILLWNDYNLKWTKKDANISSIVTGANTIWYPILLLSNSIGEQKYVRPDPRFDYMSVNNDGLVVLRMYYTFDVNCDAHAWKFPRDTMTCKLSFISSLTSTVLNLETHFGMRKDEMIAFQNSDSEWTVQDITFKSATTKYEAMNATYTFSALTVEIKVIRSFGYYLIVLQMPILMISSLIVLSTFISVADGERLAFVTELCLTYIVFLLLLDSILPKSGFPVLSICVVVCFFLAVMNVIEAVLVRQMLRFSDKQTEKDSEQFELVNRAGIGQYQIPQKNRLRRPLTLYVRRIETVTLCVNCITVFSLLLLNICVVYS